MNLEEPFADVRGHFNEIVTDARIRLEHVHSHPVDARTLQERFSEALLPLGMPDPPPAAVRRGGFWPCRLDSAREAVARWIDKLVAQW